MNKTNLWSHPPDSPISFARDRDKLLSKPVLVTSVPRGRKVPGIPGLEVVPDNLFIFGSPVSHCGHLRLLTRVPFPNSVWNYVSSYFP